MNKRMIGGKEHTTDEKYITYRIKNEEKARMKNI